MSQLKKLLGIKKKSRSIDNVSSGSIATAGYIKVKEKELPKLLKAAWVGDLAKLKTITSKSGKKAEDINQMDKQNRQDSLRCVYDKRFPWQRKLHLGQRYTWRARAATRESSLTCSKARRRQICATTKEKRPSLK